MKQRKYEDLTGKVFGKWTVLRFVRIHHETIWLCKCECGLEKQTNRSSLVSGGTTQCRRCHANSKMNNNRELTPTIFGKIAYNATSRDIEFNLSIEYCQSLYDAQDKKCALTGLPIIFAISSLDVANGGSTASLDRINNLIGYVRGNVQWIHKDVNRMKGSFNKDYFQKLCQLIYENRDYELPINIKEGVQQRKRPKSRTKISDEDVLIIKTKKANGAKLKDLAKEYNSTPGNISYIVNGLSRRSVK